MNKIKFLKKALFAVSIFFIFASCKTIPAKPLAVLVEHPERFFLGNKNRHRFRFRARNYSRFR